MSKTTVGQVVLGLETSCDETGAGVVALRADGTGAVLGSRLRSQIAEHTPYGGVVPEIAARAHVEVLDGLIAGAMADAGVGFSDLTGVAVTAGPGLIGGLLVGVVTARAIGLAHRLPIVPVNHLEGHALTVGLTEGVAPPYLLLLASGGHTQLVAVHGLGRYERLGTTLDDALGEAFDKTAKLLGLGFPGGPQVERWAAGGDARRFALPRPMVGRPEPHFSFSGLKTAVRHEAKRLEPLRDEDIRDLCASFEAAIAESVADRVATAMGHYAPRIAPGSALRLVAAGGVAANKKLRAVLGETAEARGYALSVPPVAMCGDNAAMIAWAGAQRLAAGLPFDEEFAARARWPLDETVAAAIGAGAKGAKA
jgi:N6-L-threonylcarbamoyladenine synthase